MAHPHSAGWSSGDWHQPIINFTLSLVPPWFFPPSFSFLFFLLLLFLFFYFLFFILFCSFLSFLFIYFLLSFFLSLLSFLFFSFIPPFFLISVSSTLYHLSMRVFVMSIDSNFVLEFFAWVMVIMLVHSTCQKWNHVRSLPALRVVHESTTFKGVHESVRCLASQAFSLSS